MKYEIVDFNEGEAAIAKSPELSSLWAELIGAIESITDLDLIDYL